MPIPCEFSIPTYYVNFSTLCILTLMHKVSFSNAAAEVKCSLKYIDNTLSLVPMSLSIGMDVMCVWENLVPFL